MVYTECLQSQKHGSDLQEHEASRNSESVSSRTQNLLSSWTEALVELLGACDDTIRPAFKGRVEHLRSTRNRSERLSVANIFGSPAELQKVVVRLAPNLSPYG